MNEQLNICLGDTWEDSLGNSILIIKKLSTCCSPDFYHGKIVEGVATGNIYAYNSYGQRLNHMLGPVMEPSTYLVKLKG